MALDSNASLRQALDEIELRDSELESSIEKLKTSLVDKEIQVENDEKLSQLISKITTLELGDSTLESVFKVNVQIEEPLFKERGDIWVKSESSGNIYFKTEIEHIIEPSENDIFIKLYDVSLKLILNKSLNFISNKGELNIKFSNEKILQNESDIFTGEILFNNIMKVFGTVGNVRIYKNMKWNYADSYWWDGEVWKPTCKLDTNIYSIFTTRVSVYAKPNAMLNTISPDLEIKKTFDFRSELGITNEESVTILGLDLDENLYIRLKPTNSELTISKIDLKNNKILYSKSVLTETLKELYPGVTDSSIELRIEPKDNKIYMIFQAPSNHPLSGANLAIFDDELILLKAIKVPYPFDRLSGTYFNVPNQIMQFHNNGTNFNGHHFYIFDIEKEEIIFNSNVTPFNGYSATSIYYGVDGNFHTYGVKDGVGIVHVFDKYTAELVEKKEVRNISKDLYMYEEAQIHTYSPIEDVYYATSYNYLGKFDKEFNLIGKIEIDKIGFSNSKIIFDKDRNLYVIKYDYTDNKYEYSILKYDENLNLIKSISEKYISESVSGSDARSTVATDNPIATFFHKAWV